MLDVESAIEIVLRQAQALPPGESPLTPMSVGRVIAEDVGSDIDSPPFTKSLMDGYAVRSADGTGPLRVIEEVTAGRLPTREVTTGTAARIMTGAAIPVGADAVVPHEETRAEGDTVTLGRPAKAGDWILPQGREMRRGEVVVPAGTILTPQLLGLLASVGRTAARVHPAPRVAILATGDEIVDPARVPGPGQIRNTNGPMLQALVWQAGAGPIDLGIAPDDRDRIAAMIASALNDCDVLLLTGGVSAGKLDHVPGVLADLGVAIHFHRIRMKPGKPLLFGTREGRMIFGLPGNPVSSFVGFALFVRPGLRTMAGVGPAAPEFMPMPLAIDWRASNDRPTYAPASIDRSRGEVRPSAWFGSADLRGLGRASALIQLPPGDVAFAAGDRVPTLLLPT